MKVTFLGTGTSQGIPIIGSTHPVCLSKNPKDNRLRSSVLIEKNNENIVIDCGPDFRQQMLNSKLAHLTALVFTHEHADHTAGLDDIRPFVFKQGNIPIYAHKRVLNQLKHRFHYIFDEENRYPGAPSVIANQVVEEQPFFIENIKITPINGVHNDLQIFGYRLGDFAYLTDMNFIDKQEISKLKQLEVLVINALRIESHPSHFNLDEALELIKRISPKKAYLTHISHMLGFHDEVEAGLPENVKLAYDNLVIEL